MSQKEMLREIKTILNNMPYMRMQRIYVFLKAFDHACREEAASRH